MASVTEVPNNFTGSRVNQRPHSTPTMTELQGIPPATVQLIQMIASKPPLQQQQLMNALLHMNSPQVAQAHSPAQQSLLQLNSFQVTQAQSQFPLDNENSGPERPARTDPVGITQSQQKLPQSEQDPSHNVVVPVAVGPDQARDLNAGLTSLPMDHVSRKRSRNRNSRRRCERVVHPRKEQQPWHNRQHLPLDPEDPEVSRRCGPFHAFACMLHREEHEQKEALTAVENLIRSTEYQFRNNWAD